MDFILKEFSEIANDADIRNAVDLLPENLNETVAIVFNELSRNEKNTSLAQVFFFCISFFRYHGGYTFYFPKLSDKEFNSSIRNSFLNVASGLLNTDDIDKSPSFQTDKKPGYIKLIKSFIQWFNDKYECTDENIKLFIELLRALFIITSGKNVSFGRGSVTYSYIRSLVIKRKYAGKNLDIREISREYGLSKSRVYEILFSAQRQKVRHFNMENKNE